jgi:uncharacterized protein with HEPN domain
MSYNNQERIKGILEQIHSAILDLKEWNKDIVSSEDYYCSPDGMKNLAASCMMIEAIGEGVKQIDRISNGNFLNTNCTDIPWQDIIGIRNHIAHGYFDIDGDIVFSTVKNDLESLKAAVEKLIKVLP